MTDTVVQGTPPYGAPPRQRQSGLKRDHTGIETNGLEFPPSCPLSSFYLTTPKASNLRTANTFQNFLLYTIAKARWHPTTMTQCRRRRPATSSTSQSSLWPSTT